MTPACVQSGRRPVPRGGAPWGVVHVFAGLPTRRPRRTSGPRLAPRLARVIRRLLPVGSSAAALAPALAPAPGLARPHKCISSPSRSVPPPLTSKATCPADVTGRTAKRKPLPPTVRGVVAPLVHAEALLGVIVTALCFPGAAGSSTITATSRAIHVGSTVSRPVTRSTFR